MNPIYIYTDVLYLFIKIDLYFIFVGQAKVDTLFPIFQADSTEATPVTADFCSEAEIKARFHGGGVAMVMEILNE